MNYVIGDVMKCVKYEKPAKLSKRIQVFVTEAEYNAFLEALEKSGIYHSVSDALRYLIRRFIEEYQNKPVLGESK